MASETRGTALFDQDAMVDAPTSCDRQTQRLDPEGGLGARVGNLILGDGRTNPV